MYGLGTTDEPKCGPISSKSRGNNYVLIERRSSGQKVAWNLTLRPTSWLLIRKPKEGEPGERKPRGARLAIQKVRPQQNLVKSLPIIPCLAKRRDLFDTAVRIRDLTPHGVTTRCHFARTSWGHAHVSSRKFNRKFSVSLGH